MPNTAEPMLQSGAAYQPQPPAPALTGQAEYQQTAPSGPAPGSVPSPPVPGQFTGPMPDQTAAPPPAQYVPPGQPAYQQSGQPAYQPTPYVQPAYPPPAVILAEPSPSLGLIPGESNPMWDVNVDVLWLTQDLGRSIPLGFSSYNFASHAPQAVRPSELWSDDVWFPLQPGIRFQLVGRMTDQMSLESTCWGLQHWSVGRTIYGDPARESVLAQSDWLHIPFLDDSLGYSYSSDVANAEINQRFKLYSFDPYRALTWLWGVRYFHFSDNFTLSGSNLHPYASESLNWKTKNDLVGMQLGLQWNRGWDRFQLSSEVKVGLFANIYSQHGIDTDVGTAGFQPFDVSHGSTDLSAMFEFSLLLRYRISSCMWFRAGYQYYGVTGLAIGPRQLGGRFDSDGSLGLDGLSVGLEWTR